MNRRKALLVSLLSGGLFPSILRAQDPGRRLDPFDERFSGQGQGRGSAPARSFPDGELDFPDDPPADDRGFTTERESPRPQDDRAEADIPPNFRDEPAYTWLTRDISRYTSLAYSPENPNPQNALVEWIFRRTGSAIWHGEKIAVLSAGRAQLRAYHSPTWLKRVDEVVRRFVDATTDVLNVRVRFVTAQDPRWRYAVYSRLNRIASGPHGQQIWTLTEDDNRLVQTQLMMYPSFQLLANERVRLVNGQTVTIDTSDGLDFFAGPQREAPVGQGFQPSVQSLKEGITLRFSPLLIHDGDMLDAAIDLKATTVKRLYRTKVLTRRQEVGPNDVAIDVPEVTETRLNQTVERWPLGQTLLISAGITPGLLRSKTGFFRLPGTMPTDTELLCFIDVEPSREAARPISRRDDRLDDYDRR